MVGYHLRKRGRTQARGDGDPIGPRPGVERLRGLERRVEVRGGGQHPVAGEESLVGFRHVFDAINRATGLSAADGDQERAVRRNDNVRGSEAVGADRLEKYLRLSSVRGAERLEREKIDFAESPIQGKKAVPIAGWKLVVAISDDTGRGATPDRVKHIDRVRVVIRAAPTAKPALQTPAVMLPMTDVVEARRGVPREEK